MALHDPVIAPYPGAKGKEIGEILADLILYDGIKRFYDIFGGMANIILKKRPHEEEYYNDLNLKLSTLMYVLSDEELSAELFKRTLATLDYSDVGFAYARFSSNHMLDPHSEFMTKYGFNHDMDLVQKAAEVWKSLLMSFNGAMKCFKGVHTGIEGITLEEQIAKKTEIRERMKGVRVLNENCFDLIPKVKGDPETFLFCDSPYTKKQMGSKAIYECEFSEKDQYRYVNQLYDSEAKVIVCGYDNEIYNGVLLRDGPHQWYTYKVLEVSRTMSRSVIDQSKREAEEVIWTNWNIKEGRR